MERSRDERQSTDGRRATGQASRADQEREVTALGHSVDHVVQGIANSVGGWWAERDTAASVRRVTFEDDVVYRAHYDFSPTRLADRSYEVVRPAYLVGHIAGANPAYAGLSFESIERDLRTGWSDDIRTKHGDWDAVRQYAKEAFARQRQRVERASGEQRRVTGEHQAIDGKASGQSD
jgi:PAS domain-containing protein